jgi:hypothetical protein
VPVPYPAWKYFIAPGGANPALVSRVVTQLAGSGWAPTAADRDGQVLTRRLGNLRPWAEVNAYDATTVSVGFSDGDHPY